MDWPPLPLNFNIIDKEQKKNQPTSKREFKVSFKMPGELFLKKL